MHRTLCLFLCAVCTVAHAKSLYDVLGLRKEQATPATIKKAYKKMALKWHPDRLSPEAKPEERATAEANFKQGSHAYEVLSDPENRRIYDAHGEQGLKAKAQGADFQQGAQAPRGFSSPFESGPGVRFGGFRRGDGGMRVSDAAGLDDLFSIFGALSGFPQARPQPPPRAQPRRAAAALAPLAVTCTLAQVYTGCTKLLRVSVRGQSEVVSVVVPPGCRPGSLLRPARGSAGSLASGLQFLLSVSPHPWLSWAPEAGLDLTWRCVLTPAQARSKKGTTIRLKTLDSRELVVSTKGMRIREGTRHVLKGEGMPAAPAPGAPPTAGGAGRKRGNLIIVFVIRAEPLPGAARAGIGDRE